MIVKRILETGCLLCLFCVIQSCTKDDEPDRILKVGVFGGSISSAPESETAKNVWRANLNIDLTTCGIGGAGFSSLTNNCIPTQIEEAEMFDVYILWASTNDTVGSEIGDLQTEDETTQAGGILKSLEKIKQKNSNALVLFFTSLPRFDYDVYADRIPLFVDNQIVLCENKHIPYLDQYRLCGFDHSNYMQYYLPDKLHLNDMGYASIATMQMEFIRENIKKYGKFR